jgi:RNA polymerase sigma factor (sigma-70 family)
MSTKWQSLANEESYEPLRTVFLKLAAGGCRQAESNTIWQQVLNDRWFRAEVRLQAARLVKRRHIDEQWCEDLSQEVVLLLQKKLSKHEDLGADLAQLREHFPGWMANIIRNACIDALKRQARHAHGVLAEASDGDRTRQNDLRLDVAEAATRLEERESKVLLFRLQGFTIRETAKSLGLHEWQVQYALARATRQVAQMLAPYLDDMRQRSVTPKR